MSKRTKKKEQQAKQREIEREKQKEASQRVMEALKNDPLPEVLPVEEERPSEMSILNRLILQADPALAMRQSQQDPDHQLVDQLRQKKEQEILKEKFPEKKETPPAKPVEQIPPSPPPATDLPLTPPSEVSVIPERIVETVEVVEPIRKKPKRTVLGREADDVRRWCTERGVAVEFKRLCETTGGTVPNHRGWQCAGIDPPHAVYQVIHREGYVEDVLLIVRMVLGDNYLNLDWRAKVVVGIAVYDAMREITRIMQARWNRDGYSSD
jgi:hypothetical protein